MRPSVLCNLLILLLFLHTSSSFASNIVEETCQKISGYVDSNFCVKALEADPRSGSADTLGLANIAVNLSIANATDTVSKITLLLKNTSDPTTRNGLEACSYLYTNAIKALKWTAEFIATKNFQEAKAENEVANLAGPNCEESFDASPLTEENSVFSKLTLMTTGITVSLA